MKIQKNQKFSQCGDYKIIEKIGKGSYAKVKLGVNNGEYVAIKIFKKQYSRAENIIALTTEIKLLQKLDHPNIIKLKDYSDSFKYTRKNGDTSLRIGEILELAKGGEIYEYIEQFGRLSPEVSRFYFKQLLNALIHMRDKGICHRDLKLDNLLLDDKFNLKVADFGFAKVMDAANLRTKLGTEGYQAPEIVSNREYNGTQIDIFSTGVILFILHVGLPPFTKACETDYHYQWFFQNNLETFWDLQCKGRNPEMFPQDFRQLINGMLALNPNDRFTLNQCLTHPWTMGKTATIQQIQNQFQQKYNTLRAQRQASRMQQQQAQKRVCIGKFRSNSEEDDEEEEDLTDINLQQNFNFENRQLTLGSNIGLPNEILLYQDPKFVFCYLFKNCHKFSSSVEKIHDTKYKIYFQQNEKENQEENEKDYGLRFSIEIMEYEDEIIKLNIKKLSGDYLKFRKIYTIIQNVINSIYIKFL